MWGSGRMARAHRFGKGAPADPAVAARYALLGCTATGAADPGACGHHGHFLGQSGNPADAGKASMMLIRACMAGSAQGCFEAGELGRRNPPGSKVARWEVALFYRDGCDREHALSCREPGEPCRAGNGQVQRNDARGVAILDHACDLGDALACARLKGLGPLAETGRQRSWPVHPAQAAKDQIPAALALVKAGRGQDGFEVIARLMEEGHADASWVLAGWLAYREPAVIPTPNRAQAITLAENAASQGHFAAARWVGMAHWEGDGIPVNRGRAKKWLRIAVDSGEAVHGLGGAAVHVLDCGRLAVAGRRFAITRQQPSGSEFIGTGRPACQTSNRRASQPHTRAAIRCPGSKATIKAVRLASGAASSTTTALAAHSPSAASTATRTKTPRLRRSCSATADPCQAPTEGREHP